MSKISTNFRHRIDNAQDLQSVVGTMKSIAASSIEQYESSVRSLNDYYRTVELGLGVCLRAVEIASPENGFDDSEELFAEIALNLGNIRLAAGCRYLGIKVDESGVVIDSSLDDPYVGMLVRF